MDLRKIIGIFIDDKASAPLKKIDKGITDVTQSTKNMNQATTSATQALTQNGGAMALLSTLTGGLSTVFKDAADAIKLAGLNLNTFKGVMIATGIGAFVVAVGLLAANWDKVTAAVSGTTAAQKKYDETKAKGDSEAQKSTDDVVTSFKVLQKLMDSNVASVYDLEAAFQKVVKIVPELGKFKITNPDDLTSIRQIVNSYSIMVSRNGELTALLERQSDLRTEINETFGPNSRLENESLERIDEKIAKLKEVLYVETKIEVEGKNRLIRVADKNIQLQIDELENYKELNQLGEKIISNKMFQNAFQADINKKVGTQVDLLKSIADAEKAAAEAKEKARAAAEKLLQEEQRRLEAITKIKIEIEKANDLLKTQNDLTDDQKAGLALNKKYKEVVLIFEKQSELNIKYQEAIKLQQELSGTSLEGAQRAEVERIGELIKKNQELNRTKVEGVLGGGSQDGGIADRLRIIELMNKSEMMALEGNTFDAIKLKNDAFEIERELRERNTNEIIANNKRLLDLAIENERMIGDAKSEEGLKATALRMDLDKVYQDSVVVGNEESLYLQGQTQANALQLHNDFLDKKYEAEQELIESIKIINENLQGFLGQLQSDALDMNNTFKNAFLISEKGIAAAGVIVDMIRTNRELGAIATTESTRSLASLATYDYVGAAAHGAAATKAGTGIVVNKINSGIALAAIAATTLTSWNRGGSGEGGGGGGGAPATPQAQFNIVGSSGTNQLAAQIGASQNQVVKSYVVGQDVTSSQALYRNIQGNATFL